MAHARSEAHIAYCLYTVAVNHENDTCFGNGLVMGYLPPEAPYKAIGAGVLRSTMKMTRFGNVLVMGYADCKCLAGLVETPNVVSIVSLALCQTHCKQVPDFSRLSKSDANTRSIPPVPTCGSIWVVLWLLFFRSAPSTFP